ncbi:MAG: ATP-grasp domain-containing protein [Pseudomonadota bacterium]
MDFVEHAAKDALRRFDVPVPRGAVARTADEAAARASEIGACVIKAQVPIGKRGKAGGIKLAASPDEARNHAAQILGMEIGGFRTDAVLVEAQTAIDKELYAAVVNDSASKGPMLLFSTMGGMDVEEAAERDPNAMRHEPIAITDGLDEATVAHAISGLGLDAQATALTATLLNLYRAYRALDAELLEINPLAITADGDVIALDCKLTIDDAAAPRQEEMAALAADEQLTDIERKAADAGLKYIALDGSVGVLANGAGLTMTTMDVIAHYGGRPANFLEIGGEAYTKATVALSILLENPNIKSLLVNFCGAFARTDVMAEGVVTAWKELNPDIPVFFTIHGTGEDEAIALVERELGIKPFDLMDDAVKAAVAAADGTA